MAKDYYSYELERKGFVELGLRGELMPKQSVRVPAKVNATHNFLLERIAYDKHTTKSGIIRYALDRYVLLDIPLDVKEVKQASYELSYPPIKVVTFNYDRDLYKQLQNTAIKHNVYLVDLVRYAIKKVVNEARG